MTPVFSSTSFFNQNQHIAPAETRMRSGLKRMAAGWMTWRQVSLAAASPEPTAPTGPHEVLIEGLSIPFMNLIKGCSYAKTSRQRLIFDRNTIPQCDAHKAMLSRGKETWSVGQYVQIPAEHIDFTYCLACAMIVTLYLAGGH